MRSTAERTRATRSAVRGSRAKKPETSQVEPTEPATTQLGEPTHELGGGAEPAAANQKLVAGGTILAIAMAVANAGNYLLNIVLGRWLTPAEFADANLMVTLMLLVTAVAISLQLMAARFVGQNEVAGDSATSDAIGAGLRHWGVLAGVFLAGVLIIGSPWWRSLFNSESALPFVILGLGMPAYLLQAVGRGVLQGRLSFGRLALTFVVEMLVRVSLGVGLVALGLGVVGATLALSLSFFATWLIVEWAAGRSPAPSSRRIDRSVIEYAQPVALLLAGQIIINNGDVLIAKQALVPLEAGRYAAIALVGRAVFFLSWSVATTLFPAATQRHESGQKTHGLLYIGGAAVIAIGLSAVVSMYFFGDLALERVFGEAYDNLAGPLAWYAAATTMFALANLIVSHHLALGQHRESVLLVAGAVLQSVLLFAGRSTISSLVTAQIVAMAVLLTVVALSHLQRRVAERTTDMSVTV